jgi:biopolymer transport protein ExbB
LSTTGLFGEGASYAGVNGQYLAVPVAAEPAAKGTIEAWVNNTAGQASTYWGIYSDHDTGNLFQFGIYYSTEMYFGWLPGSTDERLTAAATQIPLGSTWNHLVYTWDSTANSQVIYLNGVSVLSSTSAFTTFQPTLTATLGADSYNGFKGVLDEVRISKIARSANWVATQYRNQSAPSTFVVFGSEQQN